MGAGHGFLIVRELKNIAAIRIGEFPDLLERAINFVVDLSRMQINKLAGNRGDEVLEFRSILQFFFHPFALGDIGDNAQNGLFILIVNQLGGDDGLNFSPFSFRREYS